MSPNEAKREAEKLHAQQEATSKKLRDKAARNSVAETDSSTGPRIDYADIKVKATIPGLGEITLDAVKATFVGESQIFQTKKAAKEWAVAKRDEWKKLHDGEVELRKMYLRLLGIQEKINKTLDTNITGSAYHATVDLEKACMLALAACVEAGAKV